LTTNLKRTKSPDNILLKAGEANLPKQCVVNITQIITVDRTDLVEKIGTLSPQRVREILKGIQMLFEPLTLKRE